VSVVISLGQPPVLPEIVEQHFDELDFLWEHREANLFSRDWALGDLAAHEDYAEAHLDGLRIAGRSGLELAHDRLTTSGTFGATAATLLLWESGVERARKACLSAFRTGEAPVRNGIRIAFRHLPIDDLRPPLLEAVTGEAAVAAAAIDVLSFHRDKVPPFESLLRHEDVVVRKQALDASGRTARLGTDVLFEAIKHDDEGIRVAGWRAAAIAGVPGLASLCRSTATAGDPVAVAFLGVIGDESDLRLLMAGSGQPNVANASVSALGALGNVAAIPFLLELITDDTLGSIASVSYKRITGATAVDGEKPFPPPPVADGEDEKEELPPDPEKFKKDWHRRERAMTPDVRWQGGMAISHGVLPAHFDGLPLDSRRDEYLRLRSTGSTTRDLELEALAARQRSS
jgi:uncharacterized protein (TIGR02270 family)